MDIQIQSIAKCLNIKEEQVKNVLELLEQGSTIPFIARYRKELTGALDEEQIQKSTGIMPYCSYVQRTLGWMRWQQWKGRNNGTGRGDKGTGGNRSGSECRDR